MSCIKKFCRGIFLDHIIYRYSMRIENTDDCKKDLSVRMLLCAGRLMTRTFIESGWKPRRLLKFSNDA
jgi:hypothetical protein